MVAVSDIKTMIELASSTEKANRYIEELTGLLTVRAKLDFLIDEFGVKLVGRSESEGEHLNEEALLEDDYEAVLNAIVNKKRR